MRLLDTLRIRYLRHLVVPAMRLAGPRFAVGLARRLARGVYAMNPPGRRHAMDRIDAALRAGLLERSALGISGASAGGEVASNELAAESYEHFGRFWAEALFVPRRLTEARWRRYVRIENESALNRFVCDTRGCLIAVAYHGNIAAAACALGHFFRPLHVVVDILEAPGLAAWQRELCRQPNVRVIERREAGERVPEVLERGGAVMVVAEHGRPRGRGVPVSFMGRSFSAYPTIGVLSRHFNAPVGVVTCHRGDSAFEFEMRLAAVVEPAACGGDGDEIVRRILGALEQAILRRPSQYLWGQVVAPAGGVESGGVLAKRSMHAAGLQVNSTGPTGPTGRSTNSKDHRSPGLTDAAGR